MALIAWIMAMNVAETSTAKSHMPTGCVGLSPMTRTTPYRIEAWMKPITKAGQYDVNTARASPTPASTGRERSGVRIIQTMIPRRTATAT